MGHVRIQSVFALSGSTMTLQKLGVLKTKRLFVVFYGEEKRKTQEKK